ncbi:unnamed protein product [Diplocarpon coronariae]
MVKLGVPWTSSCSHALRALVMNWNERPSSDKKATGCQSDVACIGSKWRLAGGDPAGDVGSEGGGGHGYYDQRTTNSSRILLAQYVDSTLTAARKDRTSSPPPQASADETHEIARARRGSTRAPARPEFHNAAGDSSYR